VSHAGITVNSADTAPTAIVWKLGAGNDAQPVEVELGITDHAFTAAARVRAGRLEEGDALVTRATQAKASGPMGQGARR